MSFALPALVENPAGWGPPRTEDNLPFDIPYQPFAKADRLSRIADWVPPDTMRGRGRGRYAPAFRVQEETEEKKDDKWTTADYHKNSTQRRGRGRGRGRGGQQARGGANGQRRVGGGRGTSSVPKSKKKPDLRDPGFRRKDVHRVSSVEVKSGWTQGVSIPLADLKKHAEIQKSDQTGIQVPEETTLVTNGSAVQYNTVFDTKASMTSPIPVMKPKRPTENSSVTDSKVMKGFAKEYHNQGGAQFYATDEILATLMCARQSINSWHITVERFKDLYFLDWAKDSVVDSYTVNESAHDPPPYEEQANASEEQKLNIQPRLMQELTDVTRSLSQQVMSPKPLSGKRSVDAAEVSDDLAQAEGTPANVIYRYKKWNVKQSRDDANPMKVFARTHVDGYLDGQQTMRTFAYFDPTGGAWKHKLPSSEGAVTASELKNNCCRVSKQVATSLLAGADQIKLGFVTRMRPDSTRTHNLVHMTKPIPPANLCVQIAQSYRGMWNVLNKILLEIVKAKDSADSQNLVLLKEPNKPTITVCSFPLYFISR